MNPNKFCATNWLYKVGLRPTKQRILLANLLMGDGKHQHFTAEDLFEKAKISNSVLEIGTYMGHSLLIMLLANPKLKVTTIDMVEKYSKASTDYLQNEFPDAKIKFLKGIIYWVVILISII